MPARGYSLCLAVCLFLLASGCDSKSSSTAKDEDSPIVKAVKDDPFVLVRWAFNYLLTPAAVICVFVILIKNILRIVDEGFSSDTVEGYKRVCAAVLPLAFFVYAVIAEKAPAAAPAQDGVQDFSKWLASIPPILLLVLSAAAGVGVAIEVFQLHDIPAVVLRIILFLLSGVTCFVAYMFVSVGLSPGVNVVFGLLLGFCGTAIFLPHSTDRPKSKPDVEDEEYPSSRRRR
jgi:hypothetical protein